MRLRIPLVVLLAACQPTGTHLHFSLPAELVSQVDHIEVEVQAPPYAPLAGTDPLLQPDGRLTIVLDREHYSLNSNLEIVLSPTTSKSTVTSIGASAFNSVGAQLAVSIPQGLNFPTVTAPATLAMTCLNSGCMPQEPTSFQDIVGPSGDSMQPLGVSHFVSADRTYVVLGSTHRSHSAKAKTGAVFLVFNAQRDCPEEIAIADRSIYGAAGDGLGVAAAVGDFDGDGFEDLAVSGSNVVYVIPNNVLNPSDTSGAHTIDLSDPNVLATVVKITGDGDFGTSLGFGNLNKTDALLVSAPSAVDSDPLGGTGLIYIFDGTATNSRPGATLTASVPMTADGTVVHSAPGQSFGAFIVNDFDNDNVADLAVSFSQTGSGGNLAAFNGKLLQSKTERHLKTDAVLISGTPDPNFGSAFAAPRPGTLLTGDTTTGQLGPSWNLVIGSKGSNTSKVGRVVLLNLASTLWQTNGTPALPAPPYTTSGCEVSSTCLAYASFPNSFVYTGVEGLGASLAVGLIRGRTVTVNDTTYSLNGLAVGNPNQNLVVALHDVPSGSGLNVEAQSDLAAAGIVTLTRADATRFGSELFADQYLSSLIVGDDESRGLAAVYAVPSE